jgi:hypothetical protein
MSSNNIRVSLMICDNYTTCNVEKLILGRNAEYDLDIIKLKACINEVEYINSREFDTMELAIIDFQKVLPANVQIACCQSCGHGNFCPYGDNENEIYCLKNYSPDNKMDVVDIVNADKEFMLPKHELFYWCNDYKKINEINYTYNDWKYYFKEQY